MQTMQFQMPENTFRNLAGLGLRAPYFETILNTLPDVGWWEIHPENYFGGGLHCDFLLKIREHYPISFHAVGLSLGAVLPVDLEHLAQIKELARIYEPFYISDHAAWSASGNAHMNDLLPLPYTYEALEIISRNIDITQNFLGQTILIENPSTYLSYRHNEMSEQDFLNQIALKTGCRLLIDVNNVYVQSYNHHFDAYSYLNEINPNFVKELHIAGHTQRNFDGGSLLIDSHDRSPTEDVWHLLTHAISRFGNVPTLVEWDTRYPAFDDLLHDLERVKLALANLKEKCLQYAAS